MSSSTESSSTDPGEDIQELLDRPFVAQVCICGFLACTLGCVGGVAFTQSSSELFSVHQPKSTMWEDMSQMTWESISASPTEFRVIPDSTLSEAQRVPVEAKRPLIHVDTEYTDAELKETLEKSNVSLHFKPTL
ncbi:hypothetical protein [Calycomorphotria hydatis]|nr:hypothetical protein [Calycomorphotria hydatis]